MKIEEKRKNRIEKKRREKEWKCVYNSYKAYFNSIFPNTSIFPIISFP